MDGKGKYLSRSRKGKRKRNFDRMKNKLFYDIFHPVETSGVDLSEDVGRKMSTLEEVSSFINGKTLPFYKDNNRRNLDYLEGIDVSIGMVPRNPIKGVKGVTYNINIQPDYGKDYEGKTDVKIDASAVKGVDLRRFKTDFKKNDDSDFKSVDEIVEICDYDRIYLVNKSEALKMISLKFATVAQMFELVDSIRDVRPGVTLGVAYDKRGNRYVMIYNPKFVLQAALEEWACNGDRIYKSLTECYRYVLGFLLAHEMSHIIRHNTESSIGKLDTNSVSHSVDNLLSDSFINIDLGNVLRGCLSLTRGPVVLSSGIGKEITLRSHAKGGFKKFKSLEDLSLAMLEVVLEAMNKKTSSIASIYKNISELNDISVADFEGSSFLITVVGGEGSVRDSSTVLMRIVNNILKLVSDKPYFRVEMPVGKEEAEEAGAVDEAADGALKGKRVKDKVTGKTGIVVDDKGGKLKIVFPKDDLEEQMIVSILGALGFTVVPREEVSE